ncbi:MAG: hypothetical protein WB660_09475 [Candidatus Sulfotelmatobacter sp.]
MYTGTLINDLIATVERVQRVAFRGRIVDEMEMLRTFDLQVTQQHSEPVYAGAA